MKWQITFYNKKVEQTTLNFPPGILANFLHIAEMIEEYGPALGKPYTPLYSNGEIWVGRGYNLYKSWVWDLWIKYIAIAYDVHE